MHINLYTVSLISTCTFRYLVVEKKELANDYLHIAVPRCIETGLIVLYITLLFCLHYLAYRRSWQSDSHKKGQWWSCPSQLLCDWWGICHVWGIQKCPHDVQNKRSSCYISEAFIQFILWLVTVIIHVPAFSN